MTDRLRSKTLDARRAKPIRTKRAGPRPKRAASARAKMEMTSKPTSDAPHLGQKAASHQVRVWFNQTRRRWLRELGAV